MSTGFSTNVTGNNSQLLHQLTNVSIENITDIPFHNASLFATTAAATYPEVLTPPLIFSILTLISLFCATSQASIIICIVRCHTLQNVHFAIICILCTSEFFKTLLTVLPYYVLQMLDLVMRYHMVSLLLNCTGVTILFAHINLTCLLGVERYIYFCRPFLYSRLVNMRSVLLCCLLIYLVPSVSMLLSTLFIGRVYQPHLRAFLLVNRYARLVELMVFVVPALLILAACSFKIWSLIRSSRNATTATQLPTQQAFVTLRMILLLSGAFWAVIAPPLIIHMVLAALNINLATNAYARLASRITALICMMVPPIVNPWIYIRCRRDLRLQIVKLWCWWYKTEPNMNFM